MACNGFEKYVMGDWTDKEFESHRQSCAECREVYEKDEHLMHLCRSLKTDVDAPELWTRIESDLRQESKVHASDNYRWIFRIAALLILSVGLLIVVRMTMIPTDSDLLAASALKKVEQQEQKYQAAIAELEKVAAPSMAQLDQELMLLYRDRLETIDAQIEQCKEALALNPANAHIRKYLLAALQDKKETLKEIINLDLS